METLLNLVGQTDTEAHAIVDNKDHLGHNLTSLVQKYCLAEVEEVRIPQGKFDKGSKKWESSNDTIVQFRRSFRKCTRLKDMFEALAKGRGAAGAGEVLGWAWVERGRRSLKRSRNWGGWVEYR